MFGDGFLRRLPGLRDEADGQEQLAAVVEQPAELMGVQGAEVALGQVEVPEGARYVALDGIDPAEVLLHDGQRQIQTELPAQALGLVQIRFGGRELMAVPVCDRTVGQDALQPQMISRPPQGGNGRAETD